MSLKAKDRTLLASLVAACVAAMYLQYFAVLSQRAYPPYSWGAAVAVLILFLRFSQQGESFLAYLKAAKGELRKVVWPQKKEVVPALISVAIAVVLFSMLVSFIDTMLVKMLSLIIG